MKETYKGCGQLPDLESRPPPVNAFRKAPSFRSLLFADRPLLEEIYRPRVGTVELFLVILHTLMRVETLTVQLVSSYFQRGSDSTVH